MVITTGDNSRNTTSSLDGSNIGISLPGTGAKEFSVSDWDDLFYNKQQKFRSPTGGDYPQQGALMFGSASSFATSATHSSSFGHFQQQGRQLSDFRSTQQQQQQQQQRYYQQYNEDDIFPQHCPPPLQQEEHLCPVETLAQPIDSFNRLSSLVHHRHQQQQYHHHRKHELDLPTMATGTVQGQPQLPPPQQSSLTYESLKAHNRTYKILHDSRSRQNSQLSMEDIGENSNNHPIGSMNHQTPIAPSIAESRGNRSAVDFFSYASVTNTPTTPTLESNTAAATATATANGTGTTTTARTADRDRNQVIQKQPRPTSDTVETPSTATDPSATSGAKRRRKRGAVDQSTFAPQGMMFNDRGYEICGFINQHNKPCQRIGVCPFHNKSRTQTDQSVQGQSPSSATEKKARVAQRPRIPFKQGWTKEEHYTFLKGLEIFGRGSWKYISLLVGTRSATQIQSHAQKYFLRLEKQNKNKKSIHDFTLEELSGIIDGETKQRIQEECERQLALFNEKKNSKQNKRRSSSSRAKAKENIETKQGSPTDFAKSPSPSSDIMSISSEGTNKKRTSATNNDGNNDARNPKNRKVIKKEEESRNEEALNASIYHQSSQQYMHGPQLQAFGHQQPIYQHQHLGIRAMATDNRVAPTGFHNMNSLYNPHVTMLYHTQEQHQHQPPQHRYPPSIYAPPCQQPDAKYHDNNNNNDDDGDDDVDDVNRFEKYEEDPSEQRDDDIDILPMDSQDINTNDLIIKTLGHAKSDNAIPASGNSVSFSSFMGYPSQWTMDNSSQQRPVLNLFPSENSNSTFFKRRLFSDTTSQDDSTFGFTKNRETPM